MKEFAVKPSFKLIHEERLKKGDIIIAPDDVNCNTFPVVILSSRKRRINAYRTYTRAEMHFQAHFVLKTCYITRDRKGKQTREYSRYTFFYGDLVLVLNKFRHACFRYRRPKGGC